MFGPKRRNALKAVAYVAALRLHEVSKPYIDRGEETPREILAHEFGTVCATYDRTHDAKLTKAEMEKIAFKLMPKAIDTITRRI